jgi:predicted RNase H-like HicB family nuclease
VEREYTVVVTREQEGRYTVTVPALSDCASFGDTLPEALTMVQEAILAYLDGLRALGKEPPPDVDAVSVQLGEANEASVYRVSVREEAPVA